MNQKKTDKERIFTAALELDNPVHSAAFLDAACGHDHPLRVEVESLLKHDEKAGSFMERPAVALNGTYDLDPKILDAGLTAGLKENQAVVIGSPNHSVVKSLGQTLNDVPRVMLRERKNVGSDPIVRPRSKEMPADQADSRYRLDGEIARGGMGAIIKGRDVDLGRDLAIKVLLDSHKDKPEVVQRFIEEAQIGGQLQHPGIVPIYELGQFGDQRPFFSMKLPPPVYQNSFRSCHLLCSRSMATGCGQAPFGSSVAIQFRSRTRSITTKVSSRGILGILYHRELIP